MDKITVIGNKKLQGTVCISGAKNAALPILAATILGEGTFVIKNVPHLRDVDTMLDILNALGANAYYSKENEVTIQTDNLKVQRVPYELVKKMRASICLLGPLLGRFKKAEISMPGGCVIGPRPIDLHLKGLKSLNVKISVEHGYVIADGKKLKGGEVFLGGRFGSSVLATANLLMTAVMTPGNTVIESAACEPELVDLANFLKKMGANIEGAGSHIIKVQGVAKLKGIEYSVIPDRIEAGTFMVGAAITRGEIVLKNVVYRHLAAVIDTLREANVSIEKKGNDSLVVAGAEIYNAIDVITLPYPGFPTDMQAQMMALMTITPGISIITEKVYPERFMHVAELNRLGADIKLEGSNAIIKGVKLLSGAYVMASDLRASAGLLLAGLAAEGQTDILRVYHIDRGYEKIEEKFLKLGADITRCNDTSEV